MNKKIKYASLLILPLLAACSATSKNEKAPLKLTVPTAYLSDNTKSLALNVAQASGLNVYQDSEVDLKQKDHLANGTIYSTAFNSMMFASDAGLSLASGGSISLGLLSAVLNSSKRNFTPETSYLSAWAPSTYASNDMEARERLFNEIFSSISNTAKKLDLSLKMTYENNVDPERGIYNIYNITSNKSDVCVELDDCKLIIILPTPTTVSTPSFINNGSSSSYFFYNVIDKVDYDSEALPMFYFSIKKEDEISSNLRVDFIDGVSSNTPDWLYILNPGLIYNNARTKGNRHHQPYYAHQGEKLHFIK